MSYEKVIRSGSLLEYWVYERTPHQKGRTSLQNKKREGRGYRKHAERREDNIRRLVKNFRRLVRSNLVGTEPPALLTLTMLQIISLKASSRLLTQFFVRLREYYGRDIRYIAVPEFQKDGTLHFHSLMWGVPLSLGDIRYRKQILSKGLERTLRIIGGLWGRGFADVVRTDGSPKLSYYLSKYFTKARLDPRFYGHRVVYYSQNFPHPLSIDDIGEDSILKLPLERIQQILKLEEVDNYSYLTRFFGEVKVNRYQTYGTRIKC